MKDDIVETHQFNFYKRYVDDIINRCKKNQVDLSFNDLNNYHHNIKLTLELNRKRLLNTKLGFQNWKLITSIYHKEAKLPTSWNSKTLKNYKNNVIIGDLHGTNQ